MTSQTTDTREAALLDRLGLAATHQHIGLLDRKREQLHAAQIAAEEQFLHHLGRAWRAGGMTEPELVAVFGAYMPVAVTGWKKRWLEAVGVHPNRMLHFLKEPGYGAPNMPDGTWRGSWPLAHGESLPVNGTCVVYVLYDAANEPCYVGSSSNVRNRLKGHHADGKQFAWWTAFVCADREAAYQLEERLLSECLPYLNKKRGR